MLKLDENGLEGYLSFQKHANQEKYDLIISDINMPKLDGIWYDSKIREIDNEVPIIFYYCKTRIKL